MTQVPDTTEKAQTVIDDFYVKQAEHYMTLLLEAGFEVQSVLERGFSYIIAYASSFTTSENLLFAASVIAQATKNLKVDRESQVRAMRRASEPWRKVVER